MTADGGMKVSCTIILIMFTFIYFYAYISIIQIPNPVASPFVGLDNPEQLYGLPCRTVAVESLLVIEE